MVSGESVETQDPLAFKRAILEYWTLVEFFSPYILDNQLNSNQHYQRVFADEPCDFPWEEEKALTEDDPTSTFAKGYHLYLGIFSTQETADRARHVFCEKPSTWQSIDWRQCASPTTLSCFARLTVTKFGTPLLGTLTLSTLPWAHGLLLNHAVTSLTMESYWKGVQRLRTDLEEEFLDFLSKRLVRKPKECAGTLNYRTLKQLVETLFRWAGYRPNDYPIALIQPVSAAEKQSAKEPKIESSQDVPILNSFYIQDLERAVSSLKSEEKSPLSLYLGGKNDNRVLLEGDSGKRTIFNALRPSLLPKGRWPANTSHQQALMQQFVVNQALSSLADEGLFSVNGPPGTGKTTLLREIVAENIVARASALAQFKKAKAAFIGKRAIGFGDGDPIYVNDLHPSLLGYEMLVVSSNNAAVQNLSHELPLNEQLDPSYADASYLKPVACRLLDLKEKHVWGLVSAALGNRSNCRRLVEKIFINRDDDQEEGLRIWEWAQEYTGPSFAKARTQFLSLQKEHEALLAELDSLALLHEETQQDRLDATFKQSLQQLLDTEEAAAEMGAQLALLQKEEGEAQELLDLLNQRVQLWKKERPSIVNRLVKGESWNAWSEQSSDYTQEQITAVEELHACKERCQELRKKQEALRQEIETQEFELFEWTFWADAQQAEYEKLRNAYPDVQLPEESDKLNDPKVQKRAYYQNTELNQSRSRLFVAAMRLHEAWLAETLRPKGEFRGNLMAISHMLQGKNPTTAEDTLLAWQSLFLLIPLLSSTFASIGRLFRYLEPQSLGWVFIDEAGQALPQAAVGAIWRAKRVLSIGDPFQIEPISTVPHEIVDGMAKQRLQDHCLAWAPSQISVQNLMDAATQHGAKRHVQEMPYWLGAPLRVHRRCIEPMFSIANEIAYENSMVLATPDTNLCSLPQSCWYDVPGFVSDRQYVPAQGNELVEHLVKALILMHTPDLYVISPFREVVNQIRHLILRHKTLKKLFEARFREASLPSWTKKAIGTVHSFQGKQATAVFFVLGADATTLGSIEWATRKPNLLNVAVTRACERLYIIGDYNLWHRWPYFDVAAKKLERK